MDSVYFATFSSNLLFKRGERNSRTHLNRKDKEKKKITIFETFNNVQFFLIYPIFKKKKSLKLAFHNLYDVCLTLMAYLKSA